MHKYVQELGGLWLFLHGEMKLAEKYYTKPNLYEQNVFLPI